MVRNRARSSLATGHVPTHSFPVASPDPNPTLTQNLDLAQGRVGTWPATERGPKVDRVFLDFAELKSAQPASFRQSEQHVQHQQPSQPAEHVLGEVENKSLRDN